MKDLAAPLGRPGRWVFSTNALVVKVTLEDRFWFSARQTAATALGVSPDQLIVIQSPYTVAK